MSEYYLPLFSLKYCSYCKNDLEPNNDSFFCLNCADFFEKQCHELNKCQGNELIVRVEEIIKKMEYDNEEI